MTTTSTGPGSSHSVVDMLSHQHRLIRERFTTVLEAPTPEVRARAFFDLRRLLAVHEAATETIVHDEFTATKALADLEAMDIRSPAFISRLRLLQHNVVEHAAH